MAAYRLTEVAFDDLKKILDYLEMHRPASAARYAVQFEKTFSNLASNPYSGRHRSELGDPDLRSFAEPPYIIFYRPVPSGVIIRRILHSARNITPDFFDPDA